MRQIAAIVALGLAACVLYTQAAFAQFSYQGPVYGATFLSFPVGVRNIGMGATGTADVNSLSSGYFNPASVAYADATTFLGSYEDMYLDFGLSNLLISSPIPLRSDSTATAWHFAGSLGYTRFWLPTQTERTIFLPEGTGRTSDADDWMLSALAATSWSRGIVSFAGGGTAKLIQLNPNDRTMWSFDFGIIAAFPIKIDDGGLLRPRLGGAALNLDSGASDDGREVFVETEYRGGFGLDLEAPLVRLFERSVPSVSLSLDYDLVDREADSTTEYATGFEVSFVNMVQVRYGLIDENYITYGGGVGWDYGNVLFRMDYVHVELQDHTLGNPFIVDLDRDTFGALIGVRW